MPTKKEDDDEDEEDESPDPFDFYNFFSDPNKLFKSKQFKYIFKEIFENILKRLPSEFQNLSPEDIKKEFMKNKDKFGPFMAGFNINIGPDGKPTIDSFGNIKTEPFSKKPKVKGTREPLIEVNEEEDQIIIIAEMPGVTKEDIELIATTHSLTISTKNSDFGRIYYKEIELPAPVTTSAKARYTNGILEIKLKKVDEKHTNIKID
ncbi:MAG: archaeal heat shock protein Hsp20 [Promethearchaeota archaeon]